MSVQCYLYRLCLTGMAAFAVASSVHAQSEARIKVVVPSIDKLNAGGQYIVELSPTPKLKNRWKTAFGPLIESFAQGLDTTKPGRVDLVFGKEIGYEMHFPLAKLEGKGGFLENLKGFDVSNKKLVPGLFELTTGKKSNARVFGYLREANKYGSIARTKESVPANLANPITKPLVDLLSKGFDIAAEMKNDPADKPGMVARQANFKKQREQLEAGIQFKRGEHKSVFELRKLSVIQNLNEAERFLVETELLTANWTTDVANKKGHGELTFTAIPGTKLAESAAMLASKSSYFANVKPYEKAVATVRINFALDPMRVEQHKEFYKALRPVAAKKIDERESLKESDQKDAAKQISELVLDMVSSGLDMGVVDCFLNLAGGEDGKHKLVAGIRAADGKLADKIIGLLDKVHADHAVKLNVAEVGKTSLHSVTIPKSRQAEFQKFFPGETSILLGTSAEAVWVAVGPDIQSDLTTAITDAAGPAPEKVDPVVVQISANVAALVELFDALSPEKTEQKGALTPEQKEREKIRKLAAQAVEGCEPWIHNVLRKNGNVIEGTLDVAECALKVIGTIAADQAEAFADE